MPTIPDSHRDLLDLPVAALATVGPDGRPQVSAVWFLVDDDGAVHISLNSSRQKTKNLLANPVVDLFILDLANPARYLELRGDATLVPDEGYAFAEKLVPKYGFNPKALDQPGETRYVVSIEPVRVNAVDMSGG
jgi:PPOX class probable F420-dependent enzyme